MGSKVLLADDSVTIQKVVGIIFANEGFELTIVSTGDEAVSKAMEIKPDVLLVDALMPGKNGYEVCREIRQNPALSHTAILLMTGAFEVVDEEKNRQSGADEFITKPFESQTLIEATNRMIALTAQRAAAAPATPVAPQVAPQPAVVQPNAAPSVDDVWATGFDMEPAAEVTPEPAFENPPEQAASFAPVKATADDDLWGAFDMDAIEVTPSSATTPVEAAPADDFFFGSETPSPVEQPVEDEFILDEVAAPPSAEPFQGATGFEPVGESEISFSDIELESAPAKPETPVPPATSFAEDDFSSISFDEPVAAPATVVQPPVPPVVEEVSFAPPVTPAATVMPPVTESVAAPVAAAAVASGPATLDEAQLKTLLSSVSREVIERIVWEVVPDLAEAIIKEEIRKLKSGIA